MDHSLTIIIPNYNGADWLPRTLGHLRAAIANAEWDDVELLVVDDGSTDDTSSVIERDAGTPTVRLIRQSHAGRFAARERGLREATTSLALLCDVRVFVDPYALSFVKSQLAEHPDRVVWNGHAVTARTGGLIASFWDAITFLAWRRYLEKPTTTSYGAEDFDYFPKGTTLFLAPREWLVLACDSFDTKVDDLTRANDDTLLIRPLTKFARINISPHFSCVYYPRTKLSQFVRHSFHRGVVFVDGHLRVGSRFLVPYMTCAAAAPIAAALAIRRPKPALALVAFSSASIGIAAAVKGVPRRSALALGVLAAPFSVVYGAGTIYGIVLRLSGGTRR